MTHLGGKLNGEQTKEDRVWRAARRGAEVAIWYWWCLLVTVGLLKAFLRVHTNLKDRKDIREEGRVRTVPLLSPTSPIEEQESGSVGSLAIRLGAYGTLT